MDVRSIAIVLAMALRSAVGSCQEFQPPAKTLKTPLVYRNPEYGFCFALPADWKGFKVTTSHWSGNGNGSGESGPKVVIRSRGWIEEKTYQDIPILVFTSAQWRAIENGEFKVSAAPIGPSELGRNRKYVFALPPRFAGFDDAVDTDEVLEFLKRKAFRSPCSTRQQAD